MVGFPAIADFGLVDVVVEIFGGAFGVVEGAVDLFEGPAGVVHGVFGTVGLCLGRTAAMPFAMPSSRTISSRFDKGKFARQ